MSAPFDPETIDWDGDFVLDDAFRFVSTAKTINPGALPAVGRNIWDAYGGEDAFRTQYETVFATGRPIGFRTYFDGIVIETYAAMSGRHLRVRYRVISTIDISTLERMLETMRVATEELAKPFGAPLPGAAQEARGRRPTGTKERHGGPAHLTVVEGHETA